MWGKTPPAITQSRLSTDGAIPSHSEQAWGIGSLLAAECCLRCKVVSRTLRQQTHSRGYKVKKTNTLLCTGQAQSSRATMKIWRQAALAFWCYWLCGTGGRTFRMPGWFCCMASVTYPLQVFWVITLSMVAAGGGGGEGPCFLRTYRVTKGLVNSQASLSPAAGKVLPFCMRSTLSLCSRAEPEGSGG